MFWQLACAVERTVEAVLAWSCWRRWHQAWARYYHQRRRSVPPPLHEPAPTSLPTPEEAIRPAPVPERRVVTLSDIAWKHIRKVLPPPKERGRRMTHDRRVLLEAMLHVIQTGCDWRALPAHFPPYQTVNKHYLRWRRAGLWDSIWALLTDDTLEDIAEDQADLPPDASVAGTAPQDLPDQLPEDVWAQIEAVLPPPSANGRPYGHPRRRIVEALVYRLQRACAWRKLPAAFPPVKTVHGQFKRWQKAGVWPQIEAILKHAESLGHLQL